MFLAEGDEKFFVRGVSYGPFQPNPLGEPFPEKTVVERDFALLRRLGANTLRIYHAPPRWLREYALSFELRLLVGIPWAQHVRFLDTPVEEQRARQRVAQAASELCDAPEVLGILVGNEIPPQICRWYGADRIARFVHELRDEAKQVDPEALVSYASFPMTEYLELGELDFHSFNVYLHREPELRRYLARLRNLAGTTPLVISEFGVDSIREGELQQAEIVSRSAAAIFELGCAGAIAFSYTDEWHTGGFEVEDWAFGLVSRTREPKPAFDALRSVFATQQPAAVDPAPRISVVICAYNAERTMEECLDSLRGLRYPDFEVIVVDDGSTDATAAIAQRYPEFRLIRQENRGLSAARNRGIEAATGEIVAYTDSDCAVDPDWLTYLARTFQSSDVVGVGGPNLPPAEDAWIPEIVARSPGGPTHVLLSDDEAEHIPGCNMAFWRQALIDVGGFDPVFRAAGDDVDICWRLQDAGHRIGFASSALVWHRRRCTIRAYLQQQRGYGQAEGVLFFKHPNRFNQLGHSRWQGRIYSDVGAGILSRRPVIYWGSFGTGLFQTLYAPPARLLSYLPTTLEWNAVAVALLALGAVFVGTGSAGAGLAALGVLLLGISTGQVISTALGVDVAGLPPRRSRCVVALLSYLGPLIRSYERTRERTLGHRVARRLRVPKVAAAPRFDLRARRLLLSFWSESSVEKEQCLDALFRFFRPRNYPVTIDNGWDPWDASVHRGLWVRCDLKLLVQDHGSSKRQIDVGLSLRQTAVARLLTGGLVVGAALAIAAGSWATGAVFGLAVLAQQGFLIYDAWRLGTAMRDAVFGAFQELPVTAMDSRAEAGDQRPEGSLGEASAPLAGPGPLADA
jgi:GT2 family glycosyltransferase